MVTLERHGLITVLKPHFLPQRLRSTNISSKIIIVNIVTTMLRFNLYLMSGQGASGLRASSVWGALAAGREREGELATTSLWNLNSTPNSPLFSFPVPSPERPGELAGRLRCQVLTDHPLPGWALDCCVHTFSVNSEAIHCFVYHNLLLPQRFKISSDKAKYSNSVHSYIVYPKCEPHFYDVNTQDLSTRAPGVNNPID